jgi:hypothetical protein
MFLHLAYLPEPTLLPLPTVMVAPQPVQLIFLSPVLSLPSLLRIIHATVNQMGAPQLPE